MFKKPNISSDLMRVYKIKIYPTDEQKEVLNKHINLFRFVYNWALSKSIEYYDLHKEYIGKDKLFKFLSEFRNSHEWLRDIPLHSARLAIDNLDFAYKKFFKKEANFPKYKSKKYSKKCVHYRNELYAFNLDDHSVRIPGFPKGERIECKSHHIPTGNQCYRCTITFDGKDYWLSVNIESSNKLNDTPLNEQSIGIDVGIRNFAYLSNGTNYKTPRILSVLEKRQRRQQSRLSRMRNRRYLEARQAKTKLENIPFTKNEAKLRDENLKTRIRIKNIRNSFIHQTTSEIVSINPSRFVIEDLKLGSMVREIRNNRDDIFHSMWYKFRECLTYKAKARGIEVVAANQSYPSSQICSNCGNIKKTSFHTYICPHCGLRIDRDLNAAINLSRYYA